MADSQENSLTGDTPAKRLSSDAGVMRAQIDVKQPSSPTKPDTSTEVKTGKASLHNINNTSSTAKRPLTRTKSTSTNALSTSRASTVASFNASRSITTPNTQHMHGSSLNRPPTRPLLSASARRTTTGVTSGHERNASSTSATPEGNKRPAHRSSLTKPIPGTNTTSAASKRTSLVRSSTSSRPSIANGNTTGDRRSSVVPRTSATTSASNNAKGRSTATSQSVKPSVKASLSQAGTESLASTRRARFGNNVSELANKFGTKSELSQRTTTASNVQKQRSKALAEEAQDKIPGDETVIVSGDLKTSTAITFDENDNYSTNNTYKNTSIEVLADSKPYEITEKNNIKASLENQVISLQTEVEKLRNESLSPPASREMKAKALGPENDEEIQILNTKNAGELQRLRSELEGKDALHIEVDKLKQEIEVLKKSLTKAHETIRQEKDTEEAAKAELISSKNELVSKLSDLQAQISNLSDSHKDDQADAQTRITQLEAEIEKLSKDLLQEKESAELKSNSYEELAARNKALEEENYHLGEEKTVIANNTFSETEKLKDELSNLRQQLEENLKEKESATDVHRKQLTEASELTKNLQSEKDEKDSELLSINKVVEELQSEVKHLLQANSDGSRLTDDLEGDLKRLKDRHSAELQEKESQADNLKNNINNLKKDIKDLEEQKMLKEEKDSREISNSQTKVDTLEKEVAETGLKMNEIQVEKDTEIRELTQIVEGLQHNIIALKQHDNDAERLAKEEIEKLRNETISLREQSNAELKAKDEQSKEIKGKISALTASVAGLERENSQLRGEQEKLKTDKDSKIEQLQEANDKAMKNSKVEGESLRNECIKLKDEIKTLELAKNVAEEIMTESKEEATSLQKVLETLDKDSKEKDLQQSTALDKARADLQSALESHQAELHKIHDEHANELSKSIESLKLERDNQLEELQTKYNALSSDRQMIGEEQNNLAEATKIELENKHEEELSEHKTRYDSLSRINEELIVSSSATQTHLEDELKILRTEFDTSKAKHYETQKINAENVLNLQDRLDSITSEKQELLEMQKKTSSKTQEDHELILKRLTEDFDRQVVALRKEQNIQGQSSDKNLLHDKVALEKKVNDLEARCAQLKSSADMAVLLEEQSKLLKPRIHELEGEVASLNAELKGLKEREMERPLGSKWSMNAANADDLAKNVNDESSTPDDGATTAEGSSKGNKDISAPSDGEWSADMSLEGTMAGIQIQAQQLEELNEELASESKRMINMVSEHVQKSHTEN